MKQYIEIDLKQGGKYIQPATMKDVLGAIEGELDGIDEGWVEDDWELNLKVVTMTEKEYKSLSEFEGH